MLINCPVNWLGLKGLIFNLRNGPCLVCVYRVMDARGKLGEHERSV